MVGDSSSLDFITVGNESTGSFCLQSTPIYHNYQRTIMEQQQRKKQHYSHPWQYPGWSDENATSQMIIIYMTVHRHNAKLTLNTLNCFKDHKRYIRILNHVLDLTWPKWMKSTLEKQYMSINHCQYHACWCPGDFRSQGISRYGIDPQIWSIPSPGSEDKLTQSRWYWHEICDCPHSPVNEWVTNR